MRACISRSGTSPIAPKPTPLMAPALPGPSASRADALQSERGKFFQQERAIMQKTANTLSKNIRAKSVAVLNRNLAAAIDLHAQVKQAHWNIRGPTFIAIHELFDKVAAAAEEYSDTIAERAGALGGAAEGTIQIAVEHSFLHRYKLGIDAAEAHIAGVTEALATF